MSHVCMANGCKRIVADHLLMCSAHWRQVPQDLKNRVYATWANGAGRGTPEHRKAMNDARQSVAQEEGK